MGEIHGAERDFIVHCKVTKLNNNNNNILTALKPFFFIFW